MDWMEYLLSVATLILGGGWVFTYRAYKRKSNAEATQAEADGWKAQQDVYQQTIEDLKQSCTYIREDRNLLREENTKLRDENNELREKYNEFEKEIMDLRKELTRQGRRLESIIPFTCGMVNCANRKHVELQEDKKD